MQLIAANPLMTLNEYNTYMTWHEYYVTRHEKTVLMCTQNLTNVLDFEL